MAAFTSAAPALADVAPVSSPGPLAISQVATGTETVGQVETFTITVTNTTSGAANGVFLGDTLPIGARLTGPLPNPNFCAKGGSGGAQAFACYIGALNPGASFSISFQIIPSTPTINNRAATTGFAGGSFATNAVDLAIALTGGSTVTASGNSADVQVTGFATTGQPTAGSVFGYVFQVKNDGPQVATGVTFNDTLPAAEGLSGANALSLSGGTCSTNANSVSCSLGDMAVGASAFVIITATAPTAAGTYTNTASVASSAADPNPANNNLRVNIQVK